MATRDAGGGWALHRATTARVWPSMLVVLAVAVTVTTVAVALLGAPRALAAQSGALLWKRMSGTAASPAECLGVARAPDGGVYCTGTRRGQTQLYVSRYSAAGTLIWTKAWKGPGDWTRGAEIAVGPSGSVYVAGAYMNPLGGANAQNMVFLKYSAAGKRLWSPRSYAGLWGTENWPSGLAVDKSGNAYIAGRTRDPSNAFTSTVVLKYSKGGVKRWEQRLDPDLANPGSGHIFAVDIALDAVGDVYVAVSEIGAFSQWSFIAKFQGDNGLALGTSGRVIIMGTETGATSIAVRGSEVILAGWEKTWDEPNPGAWNMLVERYDSGLTYQWGVLRKGTGSGPCICLDTAVDGAGNVYAAGMTYDFLGAGNEGRATLMKVGPDGAPQWTQTYVPGTQTASGADRVALYRGAVYAAGTSWGAVDFDDVLTLRYTANGVRRWARTWRSRNHGNESAEGLVVTGGGVYVGGSAAGHASMVLKYAR